MNMKKRAVWADIIRILAIYLVLVVHSSLLPDRINASFLDSRIIFFSIAVTCVPLFVMLSGALLLGKKESYQTFFRKRLLRLMIPWIFWTTLYTGITIYSEKITSLPQIIKEFSTQMQSFWFLPMIFGLYLFTPAIRIFVQAAKKRDVWIVIFLWFLFISFLPYTKDTLAFPMHVDDGIVNQIINYSGYFLLGFVLLKIKSIKLWIALLSIILGILWTTVGVYALSLEKNGLLVYDFYNYISPGTVFISTGIFMMILSFEKGLELKTNVLTKKFLTTLSTFALNIYFIHALIQQLFLLLFKRSNLITGSPFDNFINAGILFLTSFGILFIFYKIRLIKKILF